jgi:hypothetical protein
MELKLKLFVIFQIAFIAIYAQQKVTDNDVKTLSNWMTGAFDSKEQARLDSNYFEIHLHMKQIWKKRDDGVWLYVEQAIVTALDKPYRQRVYNVKKINDSTIVSKVYTFYGNANRFAGAWKNKKLISKLTPDSLEDRKGCSIYLKKNNKGEFTGSTNKSDCESNLRGAKYATSKVTIKEDLLVSWDQGFDAEGKQVWGATKGGYQFVKKSR